MGLAEEIARVRMKARGSEINARHRRAREKAQRVSAAMGPPAPPDGVHPEFQRTLDQARERAKLAAERAETLKAKTPTERIEQLVREGKLPPRPGTGVGYEPTPEEILGDLVEALPPDGTEDLPDAASVLGSDGKPWGEAPGAPSEGPAASPDGPPDAPGVAQGARVGQSKRKRGK